MDEKRNRLLMEAFNLIIRLTEDELKKILNSIKEINNEQNGV